MMATTTTREPLAVLATVHYDRDASTPWTELYRAQSDRDTTRIYEVRHYPATGDWTCQCPGFTTHGHCKHMTRADRLRRVRSYSALYAGQPPRVLREQLAHYAALVEAGHADADAWAAWDFLTMRLENLAAA